jgi:hypothetical protein
MGSGVGLQGKATERLDLRGGMIADRGSSKILQGPEQATLSELLLQVTG